MRTPLTELRAKISSVRESVDSSLLALQDGLQRRAQASNSREILELLLDTSHVLSKVEKLMVELQSMPEEGDISHIEPGNKSSFSNGTVVEISENGANLEETRSMLLERIASEINRLKFYIARSQNLPFIQIMEKRIQSASLSLDKSLRRCFEIGLECHDESVIYNCLRAYAAIDNTKGAEETFRSTIVAPFIQKVIPSTPSREVVGGSGDKLEEDYQQIKTFVEKDCKFLLDIAASANSGLHVFNFIANSILKEVLSAIQKGKASALSPGKPAEFLVNYKSSMEFITFLEGFCLSKSAVGEFRLQPVYIDFVKQWNLGAYFTLRFQEIASSLDSALATNSIIAFDNSHHNQDGVLGLTMNQTTVLLDCLHRCWQDDMYIASIGDKFLRLTLQLLSRYSTWLSTELAACRRGNASSGTSGEGALAATPEDLIFIRHDVDLLLKEVNGSYLEHVMRLLAYCPEEVLALVKQSILQASQALIDSMPLILDAIIEAVVEKSVEVLRQLKGITATYRMTNKPLPVRHSPYVTSALQPLKAFLEGERAVYLTEESRNEILQSAAERITARYNELAWELVTVARKTESSLQRIRQGAQRRGGTGTDSSDSNISNTDKICMQLFLDVQGQGTLWVRFYIPVTYPAPVGTYPVCTHTVSVPVPVPGTFPGWSMGVAFLPLEFLHLKSLPISHYGSAWLLQTDNHQYSFDMFYYLDLSFAEKRLWNAIHTVMELPPAPIFSRAMGVNVEGQALLSWMHTLKGSSEILSSWNPQDTNPCNWTGVSCSSQDMVTAINLRSMQLLGTVPSQFAPLKSLQLIVLSAANLSGTLPREIGDYSNLVLLDLSGNRLTGTIPSEIGQLRNLQSLILSSNQLEGSIPPELGSCSRLVELVLFDNQLRGSIPTDLGRLSNLEIFRAGGNPNIEGAVPAELGNCTNLIILGLAETRISGTIPSSFGSLKKLQTLSLYMSMLWGSIPPELGNCSELINIYLYGNSLSGSLPRELGRLHKLEKLLLWQNNLVGSIPPEIGNCTKMMVIDLSLNALAGSIPSTIGFLKDLTELQLSANNISGAIPSSLVNCTALSQLQLDSNQISGEIPHDLGQLKHLTLLFAWQNRFEGRIPPSLGDCTKLQALDLTENRLTGSIPSSIFELKNLSKLLLLSNNLTGSISPNVGNCRALIRLRLGDNDLSGVIPKEIGQLQNLNFLDIAGNHLTGTIPPEIGESTALQMLDFHDNRLTGYLPETIGLLENLQVLDISMNKLMGPIPSMFRKLTSLNKLRLNANELSGVIPGEISLSVKLQFLDLSNNRLTGDIPREIGRIEGLDIALNLSCNYLSGPIPVEFSGLTKLAALDISHNKLFGNLDTLGQLQNLVSLNVSFNNFSGYLPDTSFFRELPTSDLSGNVNLCTSGTENCYEQAGYQPQEGHSRISTVKLIISLLFSITGVLLIVGIFMLIKARRLPHKDFEDSEIGWPWQMTPFQKLSFSVEDVVDCLVDSNIIGKGCSGVVYRADMPNINVIAVKKLWPSKTAGQERDSFYAEVKTLGSIRHRNIVRLLGYCSNNTSKLLMYDYMPNGSLGGLLHEMRGMLDWEHRYNIILGAAQGLEYLHHDCVPAIVHRDVKANNILLGRHFEPYLADFGLAKLIDPSDNCAKSSTNVAGSYGYIAPEYGYMMKITEKSDVYSYGVVLLEVLTGKQAIGEGEGMHLVEWVRGNIHKKKGLVEVLDPRLQGRPDQEIEEMLQGVGVALLCVNPKPEERPTMKDVVAMLKEIRHATDCTDHDYDKKLHLLIHQPATHSHSHSHSPSQEEEQQQQEEEKEEAQLIITTSPHSHSHDDSINLSSSRLH
ncbi:hypothetical protein KI387_022797 [Taxus chinensis]|uniref:non-specific serine/threonine protein kinase n=1 Tax=Taxus chinensis TaxID=29808 RepID=A0AA38G1W0_TAXCH|nr:hypothetical protein KI387_022797 [Taxus chinensis]